MTELSYDVVRDMLDGDVIGACLGENGDWVILSAERGAGGELVYTAMWESKCTERVVWYVKHWYHEDGTVEETFEYEKRLT